MKHMADGFSVAPPDWHAATWCWEKATHCDACVAGRLKAYPTRAASRGLCAWP